MKNNIVYIGFILLIIAGGYFIAKGNSKSSQTSVKLQVTVSFYPLYFFSSQIGGDKAQIQNITPSGSEPHDYEPTSQDIARIERSNMLVLNGGVEAWGVKIKDNLKGTSVKILVAGDGLLNQTVVEEGKTQIDPHVWLDPILAKKEAGKITDAYVEIDPKNMLYYKNNEKYLDNKLDQLDKEYKNGLASCQNNDIITSHAAFGYLSTRYSLNQVPIAGLSPDQEPSAQQLIKLAKFAKDNNVKYIFYESLVSPKLSETIANEIGAKTLVLDPLEGVSNEDQKAGRNYFTIMEDNLKNLQVALQCK